MSEAKNLWGLRLLALALAVTAWFVLTVEKRERLSEKVIEATVRYDNFPGLVVIERVESVRVGVRGTVSKLRSLNPFLVDVFVELPNAQKGIFDVPLTAENVFLPEELEFVSIEPNIIRLELDVEQTDLLPVTARLEGEPAAGAKVRLAEVTPPRVLVRGPQSLITDLGTLYTTPVDLTGHALDFQEQAAVLPPDRLVTVVQPAVVSVRVYMEIPGTELAPGPDEAEE
jgi:YbbR domain-containing protein